MCAVWLQVGQCGNQIGQEWWQIITSANKKEIDMYPFYSLDGKLSAICVDSEPKVVRRLQKQIKRKVFRESNLIVGKAGRGNNWAYGYHGARRKNEQDLFDQTMEALRKEVERKDCYCGTVIFHSLSGGTGAGLSSRLCEAIREQYPLGRILSVSVAPHQSGESSLQHYNSLLCLSWLQRYADGILLFHNDEVLKRVAALQGKEMAEASCQVSFTTMNTYITSCLAGLLHPLKVFTTQRGTVFWDRLASSVAHPLPRKSPGGNPHCSLALLAVARGPQEDSFLLNHALVLRKLKQAYRCVSWNPFPATYWTDPLSSFAPPDHHSHTLTVCANHSSSADFLQRVEQRAKAMYKKGAFLHWYQRHGCEGEEFGEAFETVGSVVEEYSHLGD
ncbi:tubulin beta-1 chain-like isoform X2 [Sceloporus undulatus]|uniref:tubulin beta-1 chain-like isoform X2 n=1 Tax=Sceloporus undulatus TaxID=8520 RepID=UPI001C4DBD28|nr:tubulin beta-1 chain-like isoform X2 [Sceloporus undulatus]